MRGMQPQLRPAMHAPPPTGCAGKAPPGSPGAGEGAGVMVALDHAAVVGPASYPTAKASVAAAPHRAIASLHLWLATVCNCSS
jgi:hypothetical protein